MSLPHAPPVPSHDQMGGGQRGADVGEDSRQPILGLPEIAELLGVARNTPARWNDRGVLPPPVCKVSTTIPVWYRHTIVVWAYQTKRLPVGRYDELPEPLRSQALAALQSSPEPSTDPGASPEA